MRIIVAMGHPAHFHLFKNFIREFENQGNEVSIVITDKDILKTLLSENNFAYKVLAESGTNESLIDKALKVFSSSLALRKIVKDYNPDLVIGGLTQIAYATLFAKSKSVFVGEDDITYTLLQGIITYPFVTRILAPVNTRVGIFKYKKIAYPGYQKLAYLHPAWFVPDSTKVAPVDIAKPYSLIRLVKLNAYHDLKAGGFTEPVLDKVVSRLQLLGKVYISSESPLPDKYLQFKPPVHINNIHHLMAFASIYIGDSQSMAVEAATLGVPSVRFNNFAGKISVLEELEHKYDLTFGIHSTDTASLFKKIDELLNDSNYRFGFQAKRNQMLSEKIDVTSFFLWLFGNYPSSFKLIMHDAHIFDRFMNIR